MQRRALRLLREAGKARAKVVSKFHALIMICIVRDVFGHLPQLSDEILRGEHRAIGQRHEIIVLIAASWHAGCDVDAKDASCQIGLPRTRPTMKKKTLTK
jgi:hypothetical protein